MNQLTAQEMTWLESAPSALLIVLALLGLGAWCGLHFWFRPQRRVGSLALAAIGWVCGSVALWLTLGAIKKFVTLEGLWGPRATALAGAALFEAVVLCYRLERRAMPGWGGRAILALRLVFVALLLLVLTEPTMTWTTKEPDERIVAVLVDDSASMDQNDSHATPGEKLGLAGLMLPGKAPPRADAAAMAQSLRKAGSEIAVSAAWLKTLTQTDAGVPSPEQFGERREQALAGLRDQAVAIRAKREEMARLSAEEGLAPRTKETLTNLAKQLDISCEKPLEAVLQDLAAADLARSTTEGERLARQLDEVVAALGAAADPLAQCETPLAEAAYKKCPPEMRQLIDEAANQPRRAIAKAVVAERPDKKPALLARLGQSYTVKPYRFAAEAAETVFSEKPKEEPSSAPADDQAATARQSTDLAGAVQQVLKDVPRNLSGVVVISDGRHNAKTQLEPVAHAAGLKRIPVAGVLVGSTAPVVDAGVLATSAPRSIQLTDRVAVRCDLKFSGLAGQTAEVTLKQAGQVVDTKKVPISSADFRTTLELADTPKQTGLTTYQVLVAPMSGERTDKNNTQNVHVQVTDDPIRLLLIEGRPRWEYRYLRNLFADRDKSVRLQYVLMHPETVEGAPVPARVPASASRSQGEAEATALPEKPDDWFLFDTIILGDVSPDELGPDAIRILKQFVNDRGGRLVVIAGRNYMPHAFTSSALAEWLPVEVAASSSPVPFSKEPGFYVRLTSEGERHAVTQLDNNAEDNRLLWESMPEQHVRYPIKDVKPGASVLAFAMPLDPPDLFRRAAAAPEDAEQLAQQRKEFTEKNALLAVQPVGSGQVLFMAFDGSWRFRYRTGDTHHHRFWGQVMRWATVNKLPAGNDLVRFGTDRPVYEKGESVVARARLRDKNQAAAETKGVSAVVRDGKREVMRKRLDPVGGSPGMYEADLGTLPPGHDYRVSLAIDDPNQGDLAAATKNAETQFVVAESPSLEAVELTADRSTLDLLARRTGGIVATPATAENVLGVLGPASRDIIHEHRWPLWHSWLVLVSLLALVTTEWIVRKKGGLT